MKKLYIVKEDISSNFVDLMFDKGRYPHHHILSRRLSLYLKNLEVEVIETTLSDLPDDGLIIVYTRSGIMLELSKYQPSFLRRVFIVSLGSPHIDSPQGFKEYSFAGLFMGASYQFYITGNGETRYPNHPQFYLDLQVVRRLKKFVGKNFYNRVYRISNGYIEYSSKDNIAKELAIYFEEYASKYERIKNIDKFAEPQSRGIFGKITNWFKRFWS